MIAPLIVGGCVLGIVATMSVFLLILRRAARLVARRHRDVAGAHRGV